MKLKIEYIDGGMNMSRVSKIQSQLGEQGIDALLISSEYNRRYVSNFTGTAGACLITKEEAFFITDFRYVDQATEQATDFEIVQHKNGLFEKVAELIEQAQVKTLGFEKYHVTFDTYETMQEAFDAELKPIGRFIESFREVKDAEELATIRKAVEIAEKGFEHILDYIEAGMTEIEVANELDFYMRSLGASGVSFETIVASGERSAMPHGVASDKKIEQGDMITIDFGCYYNGYVSDMTRTIALGDPGEELKKIHQIVLEANLKVDEAICAGMTGAELDKIARDYIAENGYGDNFGHSLGHGIGLEIHEGPALHQKNDEPLKVGNVVTNEPGIYVSGLGGVRIEDDIIITEDGHETINRTSKELIII